ncbi:CCA tRNA nucleotidyltransferase [Palleronia sp. LCG004]|uniref:CCA tRNA nucleotidyltransferase n=1 Tax=Palleronia sp. LCG004 TaxID=3079304 RepID=UPI0029425DA3|nr:CCA tRNA nucleotidyltransferase [Palleronia sp. LCG004]WOI55964.1 CCA tRNA nucleotidyltransferase [Palleronia sp. LCG004]
MILDGPWRHDPGAVQALEVLSRGGYRALVVGGCVRNAALGEGASDIDIATDAPPERVMELARAAGLKAVPTGIEHGTVTLVADGRGYEVTTFRRDVETDGRRAVVAFSDRIEDDAARRDFTMNALYSDADGLVIDPLGGLDDLMARRVRFVGEPRARIREDYLRILRYFRFHAWYGNAEDGLDAEALAASAELAEGIEQLSAERVGAEMRKLLEAPDPAPAIGAMEQAGILARILPGASVATLGVLVHLEELAGQAPEAMRRLAALGGEEAPRRLRLSRAEAGRLDLLVRSIQGTEGAAELAWRHGAAVARDVELLRAASYGALLPADLEARIAKGAAAEFPVRGADLKGRYEGPGIGVALRRMEARWIASGFALDREALLDGADPE